MEEDKIQIAKDIEQAELSFKALSSYAPNLEMYRHVKEKITMPLIETISLNPEVSLSSAVLFFTDKFLSIPLGICTNIHLFNNEPLKVIEYVKRVLKVYEIKLGELYLDLIIKIVNDPKRFQKQSPQLEYIKLELMALKIEDIHNKNIEVLGISAVEFFTGKDYYIDVNSLIESFCEVRGWVMTEQEQVNDFIVKNEVEILNQLNYKFGRYINFQNNLTAKFDLKQNNDLFQNFSATNDLDFYYNVEKVKNQEFIFETIEYFETGARKGYFKPLDFLNLFWKQLDDFENNIKKAYSAIKNLKNLPYNDEQKHILFGFILKWYGGYPVPKIDVQHSVALRLLENIFVTV